MQDTWHPYQSVLLNHCPMAVTSGSTVPLPCAFGIVPIPAISCTDGVFGKDSHDNPSVGVSHGAIRPGRGWLAAPRSVPVPVLTHACDAQLTRYPLETLPLASMTNRYHPLPESPPMLHLAVTDVLDQLVDGQTAKAVQLL